MKSKSLTKRKREEIGERTDECAKVSEDTTTNSKSRTKKSAVTASHTESNASKIAKSTQDSIATISSTTKKDMKKMDKLEEARKAFKWWDASELPSGINWERMEHAGISFPAPYFRHGRPLVYDGHAIVLPSELEEIATFYAAMPEDGPQLGDEKIRPTFQKNFFKDFTDALGPGHAIHKFSMCDFSQIRECVNLDRSLKKAATEEEKAMKKAETERNALKRGYALVDGRLEKMGNFNMEPPGLFRGRGNHPKTGELKKRTFSEQVSLNLDEEAPAPKTDLQGHAWQEVRHDPMVTWLCSWNENVQGMNKYVMLSASSSFKGKSDREKYGKAIQLKHCIHNVRKDYNEKIVSKDKGERQMGVAMWVIDVLALRVGGEKGEDEADTVGCCSLRKEHLHFSTDANTFDIELEFLGKDSMLFKQNIDFSLHGETGKRVYSCLKSFCGGKTDDDDVFETLTPTDLNKHLTSIMKGLSAKVFRTYNASVTLEAELPTAQELEGLDVSDKIIRYNSANRQVAILCNHQKTVSKSTENQLENLNTKLGDLDAQKKQLLQWKELVRKGKADDIPLKDDDDEALEVINKRISKAQERMTAASTHGNEERLAAKAELDQAKAVAKKVKYKLYFARLNLFLIALNFYLHTRTLQENSNLNTCSRRHLILPQSKAVLILGTSPSKSLRWISAIEMRIRRWHWVHPRLIIWILEFQWPGANAAKYRSIRCLRKRCVISSTGQWQYLLIGNLNKQICTLLGASSYILKVSSKSGGVLPFIMKMRLNK